METFDWKKLLEVMHLFIQDITERAIPDKPQEMGFLNQLKECLMQESEVAEKFRMQLDNLLQQKDRQGYRLLHERVQKAVGWFTKDLEDKVIAPLQQHIKNIRVKSKTKRYIKELTITLLIGFMKKQEQLKRAVPVTEAMQDVSEAQNVMRFVKEMHQPVQIKVPVAAAVNKKPEKGATHRISLELYREGKSLDEIAAARNLTRSTIEGHLACFIASGEVDIQFLIVKEKLERIMAFLRSNPDAHSSDIREELGEGFSYGEIKAAMEYGKINKKPTKNQR